MLIETQYHGAMAGLANDDHPQYLLADGSRLFSGDFQLATQKRLELSNWGGTDPDYGRIFVNSSDFLCLSVNSDGNGLSIDSDGDVWTDADLHVYGDTWLLGTILDLDAGNLTIDTATFNTVIYDTLPSHKHSFQINFS